MYKLADLTEVLEGSALVVEGPQGNQVALFKVKGQVYALDNACPHSEGPLGDGELEEAIVTCPWHGWEFDVRSGACQNMPGCDAQVIPITIKNGDIYLED